MFSCKGRIKCIKSAASTCDPDVTEQNNKHLQWGRESRINLISLAWIHSTQIDDYHDLFKCPSDKL